MSGFVYLEHPDIEGGTQVPDSLVAYYEARGWVVKDTPAELDPDAPNLGALTAAADPAAELAGDDTAAGSTADLADAGPAPDQPAVKPAKNTRPAAPADNKNGE